MLYRVHETRLVGQPIELLLGHHDGYAPEVSLAEIQARITAAGWTVRFVVHPALTVQGRTLPVANFGVAKDELVGLVVAAFGADDDGMMDRYTGLGWSAATSARRVVEPHGWRLKAQVFSVKRAREELAVALAEPALPSADYAAWRALVVRRGWDIDEAHSRETDIDAPQWQLRASRPGEHLSLDFTARARRSARTLDPDGNGGMVLRGEPGPVTARVVVLDPAVALVDAI